jgi:hypothetical protein
VRAEGCHVARIPVRGLRVEQAVVAVVPHDDQPQVVHGGEHRGPGSDDQSGPSSQHPDELPIAALRPLIGGQDRDDPCLPRLADLGQHSVDVGGVGDHHDDAALGMGEDLADQGGRVGLP